MSPINKWDNKRLLPLFDIVIVVEPLPRCRQHHHYKATLQRWNAWVDAQRTIVIRGIISSA